MIATERGFRLVRKTGFDRFTIVKYALDFTIV